MITWTDDNMDRSSMWVKWALACPKKKIKRGICYVETSNECRWIKKMEKKIKYMCFENKKVILRN